MFNGARIKKPSPNTASAIHNNEWDAVVKNLRSQQTGGDNLDDTDEIILEGEIGNVRDGDSLRYTAGAATLLQPLAHCGVQGQHKDDSLWGKDISHRPVDAQWSKD